MAIRLSKTCKGLTAAGTVAEFPASGNRDELSEGGKSTAFPFNSFLTDVRNAETNATLKVRINLRNHIFQHENYRTIHSQPALFFAIL